MSIRTKQALLPLRFLSTRAAAYRRRFAETSTERVREVPPVCDFGDASVRI